MNEEISLGRECLPEKHCCIHICIHCKMDYRRSRTIYIYFWKSSRRKGRYIRSCTEAVHSHIRKDLLPHQEMFTLLPKNYVSFNIVPFLSVCSSFSSLPMSSFSEFRPRFTSCNVHTYAYAVFCIVGGLQFSFRWAQCILQNHFGRGTIELCCVWLISSSLIFFLT